VNEPASRRRTTNIVWGRLLYLLYKLNVVQDYGLSYGLDESKNHFLIRGTWYERHEEYK
jgi:hypothetical protein